MPVQRVDFKLPGLDVVIEVGVLEWHIIVIQMLSQETAMVLRLIHYSVLVDLIKTNSLRNLENSDHWGMV